MYDHGWRCLRWLISMTSLIGLEYIQGHQWGTPMGLSARESPETISLGKENPPECGWPCPTVGGSSVLDKRRKPVETEPFLSLLPGVPCWASYYVCQAFLNRVGCIPLNFSSAQTFPPLSCILSLAQWLKIELLQYLVKPFKLWMAHSSSHLTKACGAWVC